MTVTAQEIFDRLELEPGDGKMHKGQVFGCVAVSIELLNEEPDVAGPMMERVRANAMRAMTEAATANGVVVKEDTVRRYCAVAYAFQPGAGEDDDGEPRLASVPIEHSIHGKPINLLGAPVEEDQPVHLVEIYWLADTDPAP